ncbi:MAG: response regulator [Chloroflexi bacterium]|nr:response regulator [Chloroflexota bacterium]
MLTVLVVDDEPATVNLLRELLEECGYKVLSASNGKDALSHLLNGAPVDIIVTDHRMPVMDGRDMANLIQHDSLYLAHRAIPIVLISATASANGNGYSNFAAFVRKPFTLDAIPEIVARLIGTPDHSGPDQDGGR